MQIEAQIKVTGSVTVKVGADNVKDLIEGLAFFEELPKKCPMCGAEVYLAFHRTKEEDSYYGMKCRGNTAHETNFGQHKKGDTLYYKGDGSWKDAYVRKEKEDREDGGGRRSNREERF